MAQHPVLLSLDECRQHANPPLAVSYLLVKFASPTSHRRILAPDHDFGTGSLTESWLSSRAASRSSRFCWKEINLTKHQPVWPESPPGTSQAVPEDIQMCCSFGLRDLLSCNAADPTVNTLRWEQPLSKLELEQPPS